MFRQKSLLLFLLLLVPSILCSAGCTDRGQRSGEQASAQAAPASPVSLGFDSAALSARITAIETAIEGSRRKLNVPACRMLFAEESNMTERPSNPRYFAPR